MKKWTDNIDPSTIPLEVLLAERARRNSKKREHQTGGRNGGRKPGAYKCPVCKVVIEGRAAFDQHIADERRARGRAQIVAPDTPVSVTVKARAARHVRDMFGKGGDR